MAAFAPGDGLISLTISAADRALAGDVLAGVRDGARLAMRQALNDAARSGRTQIARRVRETLNLPYGEVLDRVKFTKPATGDDLSAELRIAYAAVPLQKFKARASRSRGVTVTTIKGKGAENFRHRFRAAMDSGHVGIFERVKGSPKAAPTRGKYAGRVLKRGPRKGQFMLRQAIRETFGPSVLAAFEKTPDLATEALKDIDETLHERLMSKIDYLLAKSR